MKSFFALVCFVLVCAGSALELDQFTDASMLSVEAIEALAKEVVDFEDAEYDPDVSFLEESKQEVVDLFSNTFGEDMAIVMIEAAASPLGYGASPSFSNNTSTNSTAHHSNSTLTPAQRHEALVQKVTQVATEAGNKVAKDQIRVNAPELYKRLVKAEDVEKLKTAAGNDAIFEIPRTPIDGLTPMQALAIVKKAGINAAQLVAQKAGLSQASEKNKANAKVSLSTARKIVAAAAQAAVEEALKQIEIPADSAPAAPTPSSSTPATPQAFLEADEEMDDEDMMDMDMDMDEEADEETFDDAAPAAHNATKPTTPPVPKSAPGGQASHYGPENMVINDSLAPNVTSNGMSNLGFPNTPVAPEVRQANENKFKNLAIAAPFTQLLWKEFKDEQNNVHYVNTITNEITWREMSAADLAKKANDFDLSDLPQLYGAWKDYIVSLDGAANVKKPRDFCNPNLCLNDRPCSGGVCQCGDHFSGDLCEIVNARPNSLEWKPSFVQATTEGDYAQRMAAIKATKLNDDLATRNKTTFYHNNVYAEASMDDIMTQSVLDDEGYFDRTVKLVGPSSTRMGGFMPNTVRMADNAMLFANQNTDDLLADPRALRRVNKLNDKIMINRVKLHNFINTTGANPTPTVSPILKAQYGTLDTIAYSPTLRKVDNLINQAPADDVSPTYNITSRSRIY